MSVLTIEIPEDILLAAGQSREEFLREAKFLLAAGRLGIPVADLDEEEMNREFQRD